MSKPSAQHDPDDPRSRVLALAAAKGLDPEHPPTVVAETEALVADPRIDDLDLTDLRGLPFCTIDEPHSRDLDQALFVERSGRDLVVWYALADAAHFVRPGTHLFAEALQRGSSYYLPGLVVPMLPRPLSEGIVSLNPEVDRRAMVFRMVVDPSGRCTDTRVLRARVHSRAKLSYDGVQAWLDGASQLETEVPGVAASLELLRDFGELRIEHAEERGVVHYRRAEVEVGLGAGGFVALDGSRNDVERYNEQVSLLCNVEGARLIHAESEQVQPVFRVHAPPGPERLAALEEQISALVRAHRLDPARWSWQVGRSLAGYLRGLPTSGPEARIALAIHRQAVLTNHRSVFSPEPGGHHGVGADLYARFTAPMREVVGVFVHKEAWERLSGQAGAQRTDEELRARVVDSANRARSLQRELDREANRMVLDQMLGQDLREDPPPVRTGTVMGLTRSKVHVKLDDPALDVKVYVRHLEGRAGRLDLGPGEVSLVRGRQVVCRVGDPVGVRVVSHDDRRNRWRFELVG